jgi:hypothetical protein
MTELVKEWGPVAISVLLSLGAFGWLAGKIKESRLVRRLRMESLVDSHADTLVVWAEKYSARQGGLTGGEKLSLVKSRMAERLGQSGCSPAEGELEEAIEAAHTRMLEGGAARPDFPADGAASS